MKNKKQVVAIVDNDAGLLKAVERLVLAYGFEPETFTSAELYLQRSATKEVDCLVLDINLDGISGLELQKILIANGSAPPIIFITGQGEGSTVKKAIDQGCIAFLHKPFESQQLRSALTVALATQ